MANNLLGPACCDEGGVWLCLCGDSILIDLADGETGEYTPGGANNNHPECCVTCPDGSHSIVVATVTRTGNDYEILLTAPDCPEEEGCGPLPYCVECDRNPGFTETGELVDGVGVVLCGDGPTITMIDQGDDTVQITSFYQDVLTVLGTLPCPYVGCTEFSLDDRSRLKLGPDCECAGGGGGNCECCVWFDSNTSGNFWTLNRAIYNCDTGDWLVDVTATFDNSPIGFQDPPGSGNWRCEVGNTGLGEPECSFAEITTISRCGLLNAGESTIIQGTSIPPNEGAPDCDCFNGGTWVIQFRSDGAGLSFIFRSRQCSGGPPTADSTLMCIITECG